MNKPKIKLRDVDFDAMTDEERAAFRSGFDESETLAHTILKKIAAIKEKNTKEK